MAFVNLRRDVINANQPEERINLLADISTMYFMEGKTQSEIAKLVGMTRSNVSRLLKEARESGVVRIEINRPINFQPELAQKLVERFSLINARIIDVDHSDELLQTLGRGAAKELIQQLEPENILATAWGTGISATVDQIEETNLIPGLRIVQLLGAPGAHVKEYDAHAVVRRLEEKLDAEGIYFHAPFFADDERMAKMIMESKSLEEPLRLAKRADVALLGVGSIEINYSSYYLAGYLSKEEVLSIKERGAVGDVCAQFFDKQGSLIDHEYKNRMIGMPAELIFNIPVRIGVAGGHAKIEPIIGALKGNLINVLISDTATATEVLKRTQNYV